MKRFLCIVLLAALWPAPAADPAADALSVDDLARAAEDWAQENLDPDVLSALDSADRERVEKLLAQLQKEFDAQYVIDLAALKDAAKAILPLLQAHEETVPYALWLKTQIEYLDVAEQFRSRAPAVTPPRPAPNPAPAAQRRVWAQRLAKSPWPEAARAHVPALKRAFAEQGVPAALVWIAEVESAFDPRARSPKGAAGLFQLMPATARSLGLRTWPLDQRLKPEPSAKAAAQYLKNLHARFKDWRLVLAAYNAGEGIVGRLLKSNDARSFDRIAPQLPAETQMYVPRVEATILRREGLKLESLGAPSAAKTAGSPK